MLPKMPSEACTVTQVWRNRQHHKSFEDGVYGQSQHIPQLPAGRLDPHWVFGQFAFCW